jgi:hypothetical protein
MTTFNLEQNVDYEPLIAELIEKTKQGKVPWQATASEKMFLASVSPNWTLRISSYMDNERESEMSMLAILDANGREVELVHESSVKAVWLLYLLAKRIGNRTDETICSLMEDLDKL